MFLIKRLVIPLVVLAAVFFGVNYVAARVAEDRIAQAAQSSFDLEERPEVSIDGFPVLVNVLTGSVPALSFRAEGAEIEGLALRELTARFEDVDAEGGLLRSAGLQVVIGRGEVRGEATDRAVNAFLRRRDVSATIAFEDNRRATVRTRARIAGRQRTIVATGTVRLEETRQRLRFAAERVTVDGRRPGALESEAKRRAAIVVELPRLPGNLRITVLQTGPGFVALAARLEGFRFPPDDGTIGEE